MLSNFQNKPMAYPSDSSVGSRIDIQLRALYGSLDNLVSEMRTLRNHLIGPRAEPAHDEPLPSEGGFLGSLENQLRQHAYMVETLRGFTMEMREQLLDSK